MNLSALCMCVWFLFPYLQILILSCHDLAILFTIEKWPVPVKKTKTKPLSFGAYSDTKLIFYPDKWIKKYNPLKMNQEFSKGNGKKKKKKNEI